MVSRANCTQILSDHRVRRRRGESNQELAMDKYSGIIPQGYGWIKGKEEHHYYELSGAEEKDYSDRRFRRRRNKESWKEGRFSVNNMMKAVKKAYVNVMFSLAAKTSVSSGVLWKHQTQMKELCGQEADGPSGDMKARYFQYLRESGRWDDGADRPVMYIT